MEKTVLFVDDEPEVLHGLLRSLRKEPYRFLSAGSADEAMAILQSEAVDVIVSDEEMPGMSGADLLAHVRQQHPNVVRIMLTGKASVTSAMRAIYDGWVYQYLHKPCNPADLASSIYNGLLLQSLQLDESPHVILSYQEQRDLIERVAKKKAPETR